MVGFVRGRRTWRVQFALWIAGLFMAVFTVFGAFVHGSLAHSLAASIDDSLSLNASQVLAGVNLENGQLDLPETFAIGLQGAEANGRRFTVRVLDPQGKILREDGPYPGLPVSEEALAAARRRQSTFATLTEPAGQTPVRVYTVPLLENNQVMAVVQVAQSLAGVQDTLRQLLTTLLASLPLLVILAGGSGYFLAARALAPIDEIIRTARRISAEDLSARLNLPATDDEVGRLAATFDAMLGRLDKSFQRERRFVADASHELRTPLAAMQTILSVIRQRHRSLDEYQQALADLNEEAERLRALTEDLLRLARGGTHPAAYEPTDLSTLLRDVTDSLRPLAVTRGLQLNCAVPDGLTLNGDSDSLARLFVNLVDNAIKYTERGGVTLSAEGGADGTVRVSVADSGAGISADHLPHIFERFYRADPARAEHGAGLGLSIALDIAHAHRGTIDVSSEVGRGTTFVVSLPQDGLASPD